MKKILIILVLVILCGIGWKFYQTQNPSDSFISKEIERPSELILFSDVPFTAQAPNGDWGNIMFQEGCEEASILMAIKWARGESLTTEEAAEEIKNISSFEENVYGDFYDRSAKDTVKLIEDYFNYKTTFRSDIHVADIIKELERGNLVVVPMNGKALKNPFYTPPGPEKHMLLVIGYDPATQEIITNDPGTRRGEQYRYPEAVFENALLDYPTGKHLPITKVEKNMIVVSKK